MFDLARMVNFVAATAWHMNPSRRMALLGKERPNLRRATVHYLPHAEELEHRIVPTLLGKQLFPADYPWNQNISNAPVAANSAAIIAHIGSNIGIHPDWGEDSAANGNSPLNGIPVNVVHGNSTAKINVVIDNYPGESDIVAVPIPANAVIEGDYQNGPNTHGGGYNANQRGDSHLIVWDEDNNIAYEFFGVTRPSDTLLFPDTNGVEHAHTDGLWHAAQETVWNMGTDSFRSLGATSADAAGLSILAGLARPDEGLPTSQGGQGAIDHALRFTLPSGDVNPQYIYPASHVVNDSMNSSSLPFGGRLRLENTPAVNQLIASMGPEAQVIAHAMQQYGLVLADIGSPMFVTGTSAAVNANNQINLVWNMDDVLGLESLTAADFQVVNLTPVVSGLSTTTASPGATITITGQNFSGSAGHLSVFFGNIASSSVTYLSDSQLKAVVPNGSGTVNVTVRSGVALADPNNPADDVTNPVFGYGTSAVNAADSFTFNTDPVSGSNSTVSFASSTDASGTADTATAVVKDSAGNPISGLATTAFYFSLAGGTSLGHFTALVETATAGTYVCTFTGTIAGTAQTLSASINGVGLIAKPTISVVAGAVSSTKSTIQIASASVTAGTALTVTIVLKDAAGNAVSGIANSLFNLNLTGGVSTGTFGPVTESAVKGTYTTSLTGAKSGTASALVAVVAGVTLVAPTSVTVVTGPVSSVRSTVRFSSASVRVGATINVIVVVQDAAGNAISGLAASAFYFALVGGTSVGRFSIPVATATPGTYLGTFTGRIAGTVTSMSPRVAGVYLSVDPLIQVTP
jgi:hypothetical protein